MNKQVVDILNNYFDISEVIDAPEIFSELGKVVVDLFFSNKCNLRCSHCYFGKTQNTSQPLTFTEWTSLVDSLFSKGIKHFHISGKECSLNLKSYNLVKYIKNKNNTYCGIVTNGTGSYEYYKNIIETGIDYVEFSIDGLRENHNIIRNQEIFDSNVEVIKKITKISSPEIIDITTTLNKKNYDEYLPLVSYFKKIGINRFFATPFLEKGNGAAIREISMSSSQYIQLIEKTFKYLENTKEKGIIIKYCIPHFLIIPMWNESKSIRDYIKGYFSGENELIFERNDNYIQLSFSFIDVNYLNMIVITNDGYVIPCADDISTPEYAKLSLGNIKDFTIEEILTKRINAIKNEIINI